jgi:hypothetical protein
MSRFKVLIADYAWPDVAIEHWRLAGADEPAGGCSADGRRAGECDQRRRMTHVRVTTGISSVSGPFSLTPCGA